MYVLIFSCSYSDENICLAEERRKKQNIFLLSCLFYKFIFDTFQDRRIRIDGRLTYSHCPPALKPHFHNLCSGSRIRSGACLSKIQLQTYSSSVRSFLYSQEALFGTTYTMHFDFFRRKYKQQIRKSFYHSSLNRGVITMAPIIAYQAML